MQVRVCQTSAQKAAQHQNAHFTLVSEGAVAEGSGAGRLVAEWLKHSTANCKVGGWNPTMPAVGDFFSLLGAYSTLP